MLRHLCLVVFLVTARSIFAQHLTTSEIAIIKTRDSIKKTAFLRQLGNGFLPFRYFDTDLRYLIKFNQYEGVRTGLGGTTNKRLSERYRLNGYIVYGFTDKNIKYSIGGGFRINETHDTWINLSYTEDLTETGSSNFLTDKRFFTFFEPRLLNIDLFHKHITQDIAIEHRFTDYLLSETRFSISNIEPTYFYNFIINDQRYNNFDISSATLSLQWSPFNNISMVSGKKITHEGYPKFTVQFIKSFKSIFGGDFNFYKLDFRTIQQFNHNNNSNTKLVLVAGMSKGDTPLTHLYHAYPNNINKETILQRFSVAGLNCFETMYFNEFFSDKFATLQLKHVLRPFKISERFKPEVALITRYAIGDMNNIERHEGLSFNTLTKIYSESGFEINKLFFGFGLSFAYRYGAYHLARFEDNFAFKFTFNITL